MPEAVTLRNAVPADEVFLFALYAETRADEFRSWGLGAQQQEALARMQFDARQRSYAAAFPCAADRIVCVGALPIGRLLTCLQDGKLQLVDVALLGSHRQQGIGANILRQLIEECATGNQVIRLQVLLGNPAQEIYRRLGFAEIGRDGMYIQMEHPLPYNHVLIPAG